MVDPLVIVLGAVAIGASGVAVWLALRRPAPPPAPPALQAQAGPEMARIEQGIKALHDEVRTRVESIERNQTATIQHLSRLEKLEAHSAEIGKGVTENRIEGQKREEVLGEKISSVDKVSQEMARMLQEAGKQMASLQKGLENTEQRLLEIDRNTHTFDETLVKVSKGFHEQIAATREELIKLQKVADERAKVAQASAESVRRLESVLTGSQSRGAAGENILDRYLQALPPELREYNLAIGDGRVEFAIPLPNGRYLPVDSKVTGLELLVDAEGELDPIKDKELQKKVSDRVKEVAKYLDDERTENLAVLVLPDAVYERVSQAHVEAWRKNVMIVSYTMVVPYLLTLVYLIRRYTTNIDQAQLSDALRQVAGAMEEIENHISRKRFTGIIKNVEETQREIRIALRRAEDALRRVQAMEAATGQLTLELGPSGTPPEDPDDLLTP